MSSVRGCDNAPRHDPSKYAQRVLRGAIFLPHLGRFGNPKTYIWQRADNQTWWDAITPFLGSWDHYPNHYVWHFIHAAQIIGYLGPQDEHPVWGERWREVYRQACVRHHVMPEPLDAMNDRLNADEAKFNEAQQ